SSRPRARRSLIRSFLTFTVSLRGVAGQGEDVRHGLGALGPGGAVPNARPVIPLVMLAGQPQPIAINPLALRRSPELRLLREGFGRRGEAVMAPVGDEPFKEGVHF